MHLVHTNSLRCGSHRLTFRSLLTSKH
uniref:Uncharacterized protein n=1 Tax=Anguilla anguilla TaxID=7936 RepID=A0A0E9X9Z4_ANGAN